MITFSPVVPPVNNFNKSAPPLNFQDDVPSHLFCRKFCLTGNIFLLFFVLFLLKHKGGDIYSGLHLPRDKELEMSLAQLSVSSRLYWKSFLKSIGGCVQLRPISSLEWTFPQEQLCQASVASFPTLTGCFPVSWTVGVNKNLSQHLPSAHYSWARTKAGLWAPRVLPPPPLPAHGSPNLSMEVSQWKREGRWDCGNTKLLAMQECRWMPSFLVDTHLAFHMQVAQQSGYKGCSESTLQKTILIHF